ncbi:MAG: type IV secretion system DNA-binding domain-containing protein [Gemmatimonadota bacterium]|nr:type IV secretion system DNA-binding domain-containing protein [Gemmatimonadota bacterium]
MTTAVKTFDAVSDIVHRSDYGSLFFAFRVRRFFSISALGVRDEPPYHDDFRRRQIELITSLTNRGHEGRTYEFRLVSHPDREVPARGQINTYVVCRMDQSSKDQAEAYASEFSRMLTSTFPEYEFEGVSSAEMREILAPFPVSHALGIRRRVGSERLDTITPGGGHERRKTRKRDEENEAEALAPIPEGSILHVYPFLPTRVPFNNLFRLLLREPQGCAISVRLQPTRLSPGEINFLEHSIAICERYTQVHLGQVQIEYLTGLFPTLRERARAHGDHLSRLLFGLRDNAALTTVTITSAAAISAFVPEAMAAVITEPAGGIKPERHSGISSYLAGGYEVFPIDAIVAEEAMKSLEVATPNQPLVPPAAQRLPYLFDSIEAATSILLPPITTEPLPGVEIRGWRPAIAPRTLAETGVLLGETVEPGTSRLVRITPEDRLRHLYTVGQTGTGKSTLLRTMILDDIHAGSGVCVLDPHGDLYKDLLGRIPEERIEDVVLIDPTDVENPVGLNLLEVREESQRHFVVQELTAIVTRMLRDSYGDAAFTMTGPLFYQHMRMNLLLVMSDPDNPGTLMDFYRILQDREHWKKWTPLKTPDPMLDNWVNKVLPSFDYTRPTSDGPQFGAYISSKFESFLFDPMLRAIFSQQRSTVSFRTAMDTGKIVLVNLAKGELSEPNSTFLGMMVLAMIQATALTRVRMPASERRPFYVYVDEFQSIATENFVTLLSEGRKFGMGLTLANQFVSQIHNEKIMASIFGNVGTLVFFRLGDSDAARMETEMAPTLCRNDLLDIPNWHAYISALINNQTVRPFEMRTLPDKTLFSAERARAVRAASRASYGVRGRLSGDSPVPRSIEPEAAATVSPSPNDGPTLRTLFDGLSDDELIGLGVPKKHLGMVREATVATVMDVIAKLPRGLGLKILELSARLASENTHKAKISELGTDAAQGEPIEDEAGEQVLVRPSSTT